MEVWKEGMSTALSMDNDYHIWLINLKEKVRSVQIKAAVKVNSELLTFYWELGRDIVNLQKSAKWGDGFLKQLSNDLITEFPEMKGFSKTNLKYIKRWYLFYFSEIEKSQQVVDQLSQTVDIIESNNDQEYKSVINQQVMDTSASEIFRQQVVAQIIQIPWGHNIAIITKCKNIEEAAFYVQRTLQHSWSRSLLVHQIENGLFQREGNAITNFSETLPMPQSNLAQQTLKDPYIFDFMTLSKDYSERELENGLIEHITNFLLELGAGFAYIGKQIPIQVSEREFFLDLLFYHTQLHSYVVVELKTVEFEPEHAGKLNFYIKAIDEQLRKKGDKPTIGILLCKSKDKVVVEYSLSDIHKPMGVSEYHLTQSLPDDLKSSLPSIEEIEAELSEGDNGGGHEDKEAGEK